MKIKFPPEPWYKGTSEDDPATVRALREGRWFSYSAQGFGPETMKQMLENNARLRFRVDELEAILDTEAWHQTNFRALEPPYSDWAILGAGILDRRSMEIVNPEIAFQEHPELWQSILGQFAQSRLAELPTSSDGHGVILDGFTRAAKMSPTPELTQAYKTLTDNLYWVEGPPNGGEQNLYRSIPKEGQFEGTRTFVCRLQATQVNAAMLEAAEIVKRTLE